MSKIDIVLVAGKATGSALQRIAERLQAANRWPIVLIPTNEFGVEESNILSFATVVSHSFQENKQVTLETGEVYFLAPGSSLQFSSQNKLYLFPRDAQDSQRDVVDNAFESAARCAGEKVCAVVLNDSTSLGSLGLKVVSDNGGLTLVQSDSDEPLSETSNAISILNSEIADRVLPLDELVNEILSFDQSAAANSGVSFGDIEANLASICESLHLVSGHDFRHYKRSTLIRRILRRVQVLKLQNATEYVELLQTANDEVDRLFKDLLINVTSFFRDPTSLQALYDSVIKTLVDRPTNTEKLRVWVAGCSTGEEAYTLAMLFLEAKKELQKDVEVQVIATDVDDHALSVARRGVYSSSISGFISEERIERFFNKKGSKLSVKKELRDLILFSKHNLINDPPFSQIDLISCRNVLIYFGSHLQQKMIPVFHYSLKKNGYLFLGNSETVQGHGELFKTLSAKDRIAQKKSSPIKLSGALETSTLTFAGLSPRLPFHTSGVRETEIHSIGQRILLDEFAPRFAIVNDDQDIVSLSEGMKNYLDLPIGVYEGTLAKLLRTELKVTYRSTFRETQKAKRKMQSEPCIVRLTDRISKVKITVQPMPQLGTEDALYIVVFTDLGTVAEGEQLSTTSSDSVDFQIVEQLERELANVKTDLERTVQDLEASNEELKSSNEELLSINEELQSANEELESSKEEVQAANESLHLAKTDLENLFSSTQVATLFMDDNLTIRSFTPKVSDIYNILTRDIGRSLLDLSFKATSIPNIPLDNSVPVFNIEDEVLMPGGDIYLRRILPYKNEDGKRDGIVVTFTDVSEIRKSERLFRAIADSVPALTWTLSNDLNADYFNRRWFEATGLSFEESKQAGWLQAISKEERERFKTKLLKTLKSNVPFNVDVQISKRGKEKRWYTIRGVPASDSEIQTDSWAFSAFDIDAAKTAQLETAEREQYFRELANLMPQLVWRADQEGTVTFFSQQWLDYVGDENLSHAIANWLDAIHPEDRQRCVMRWNQCVESGADYEIDYRIRRYDGTYKWFFSRATRLKKPTGKFEWVGTSTDMDARKKSIEEDEIRRNEIERKLALDRSAAEAASDAKSSFLANMSHEIRTPLGAIIGFSEILEQQSRGNSDSQDLLTRIVRNARQLSKLIDEILDLSKVEADRLMLEHVKLDPNEILADALSVVELKAHENNTSLTYKWLTDVPRTLFSDPTRIRQILFNVLGNAAKFTENGNIHVDASFLVGSRKNEGILQFDVKDTGIGLNDAQRAMLFQPFSQADASISRKYGGTGLGLTLSRKLAEALGGSLELLSSTLGKGSEFRIRIHVETTAAADASKGHDADTTENSLNGIRVLVIDDSPDNTLIVKRYLESEGIFCEIVNDSTTAAKFAMTRGYSFDLIFLDIQMPVLDGYGVLQHLRANGYDKPVVALTAHAMKDERMRADAAGFNRYLTKPINRKDLIRAVSETLLNKHM